MLVLRPVSAYGPARVTASGTCSFGGGNYGSWCVVYWSVVCVGALCQFFLFFCVGLLCCFFFLSVVFLMLSCVVVGFGCLLVTVWWFCRVGEFCSFFSGFLAMGQVTRQPPTPLPSTSHEFDRLVTLCRSEPLYSLSPTDPFHFSPPPCRPTRFSSRRDVLSIDQNLRSIENKARHRLYKDYASPSYSRRSRSGPQHESSITPPT